jgi:hypothetical protein
MIYVIDFEKFTCGAIHVFRIVVHKETMSVLQFFGNKRYDAQSQIMWKVFLNMTIGVKPLRDIPLGK